MNPTQSSNTGSATGAAPAVLPSGTGATQTSAPENLEAARRRESGERGYGLPCAKCKTYYSANLSECPVCRNAERVSPVAAPALPTVERTEAIPDPNMLEEERERFLRQFKSQVYSSHMQINAAESFRCSLEDRHQEGFAPASICKGCYDTLQARADVMEAALHIDLKEAAQIIYDAVWSDPSDPTKTYQNAAQALLSELHGRAGISAILGPLQPLAH
jgi:hypothetical protein